MSHWLGIWAIGLVDKSTESGESHAGGVVITGPRRWEIQGGPWQAIFTGQRVWGVQGALRSPALDPPRAWGVQGSVGRRVSPWALSRGGFVRGRVLNEHAIHFGDNPGANGWFLSQLPFKCYLPQIASVGDRLKNCLWVASRVAARPSRAGTSLSATQVRVVHSPRLTWPKLTNSPGSVFD